MKHVRINLYTNDTESHPAGVRGLKLSTRCQT